MLPTRRHLPLVLLALAPLVGCGPEETPLPQEGVIGSAALMDHSPDTSSVVELDAYCDDVTPWNADWADMEGQVLKLVNEKRAAGADCPGKSYQPAPALTLDTRLRCSSRKHSKDMGNNNIFSHNGSNGSTPWDRMKSAGFTSFSTAGENIAAGQTTPQQVVNAWMSDLGHCSNVMNPAFKKMGTGYFKAAGSQYTHYWTQDFATP